MGRLQHLAHRIRLAWARRQLHRALEKDGFRVVRLDAEITDPDEIAERSLLIEELTGPPEEPED